MPPLPHASPARPPAPSLRYRPDGTRSGAAGQRENTLFQHLQTLQRNRNKRHRAGEFVVEGVRAINQALAHRWTVKALVYGAGRPLSAWARGVLAGAPDATRVEMLPALLQRLSDKEETSELLAVLAIPPDSTARLPQRALPLEGPGRRPAGPGGRAR